MAGFMGLAGENIEMLFVDNGFRRKGLGRQLVRHAVDELHATTVDVNEQNTQAVEFYQHIGFRVVSKSEQDSEGKPYPILHLRL